MERTEREPAWERAPALERTFEREFEEAFGPAPDPELDILWISVSVTGL